MAPEAEGEIVPRSPEPLDAEARLAAIAADPTHPANNPGHPQHLAGLEEKLAARRAALGAQNTAAGPTYRDQPGEGPPAHVAPPAPTLDPERPALTGGARFDDALVGQLETALTDAGLTRFTATALLGTLAQEFNQGTLARWDEDESGAYLRQKYGLEGANALIEDAQRAAALLPKSVKDWLRASGGHTNPKLILEAALIWRRSRHARR